MALLSLSLLHISDSIDALEVVSPSIRAFYEIFHESVN